MNVFPKKIFLSGFSIKRMSLVDDRQLSRKLCLLRKSTIKDLPKFINYAPWYT